MRSKVRVFLTCVLAICSILALAGAAVAASTPTAADGAGTTVIKPVFPDISQGDPNLSYINYLYYRGLVKGFPDGSYHPTEGLTRAQAATLLVQAAGLKAVAGAAYFSDVPTNHWASGSVAAAAAAGLIHGYPDGTFRPDAALSRAEGVVLCLSLIKQSETGSATLPALSDLASDHWAAHAVAVALASGMITTASTGRFAPNDSLTRSDLARALGTILIKYPDYYRTTLSATLKPLAGAVTVTGAIDNVPVTIKEATPVIPGDTVKTAAGGSAEIDFPDGSSLLLKENTVLVVKEMRGQSRILPDGKQGATIDWLDVSMQQGKLFGSLASRYQQGGQPGQFTPPLRTHGLSNANHFDRSIRLADQQNSNLPWWQSYSNERVRVQVDMPWGVAGMEGTYWQITVDQHGVTVSTADGTVQVTGSNGQIVSVPAGFQTVITSAVSGPATPITMTSQNLQDWQSVQTWVQQTAAAIQAQIDPTSTTIADAIVQAVTNVAQGNIPQNPNLPQTPPSNNSGGNGGNSSTTKTVSSVAAIPGITAPYGTALGSVGLPPQTTALLNDGTQQNLTVTWDGGTPAYSATTAGTYAFLGIFNSLPSNITNPGNVTASVYVIVRPAPVLTALTLSGSPALTAGGSAYDLTGLTIAGTDQFNATYPVKPAAVTWAIATGVDFASITASQLQPSNSAGSGSITASVTTGGTAVTSNPINFIVNPAALATLALSGNPGLAYNGQSLSFDLVQLTLAGQDQYGNNVSVSPNTTTWSVDSTIASLGSDGHTLTITGSGTVTVTAAIGTISSNAWGFMVTEAQVPSLPETFYGTVTVNSSPAPDGTWVTALVNGSVVGSVYTQGSWYGSQDAVGAKLVVGAGGNVQPGDTIEFAAGGRMAKETATFQPGIETRLDLHLISIF